MCGKKVSDSLSQALHCPTPGLFNNGGTLHGGELFKMIDDIGGMAAMRHAGAEVVTASVNWLNFISPVLPGELVVLKSSVQAVGRTSLEVGVRVEVEDAVKGLRRHGATCYLTYVAVDGEGRPQAVPPLVVETDLERERMERALARKKARSGA